MRAMCPHCGGKGCDQPNCVDGYLQVTFAEGDWWTRLCLNHVDCGFVNGGRICEGFPPESSGPCVVCGGPTDWVSFDDVPEVESAEELGHVRNHLKFAVKTLEESNEVLREKLKELREYAASWRLLSKNRKLSIEEAKLLNICVVCHGPAAPIKEKGPFCYKPWAHEKCSNPEAEE